MGATSVSQVQLSYQHQSTSRGLQSTMGPGSSHSNHRNSSRHTSQLLSSQWSASSSYSYSSSCVSSYTMATFLQSLDMCPSCPHFQHRGLSFPFPFIAVEADLPLPLMPCPFSGSGQRGTVFRFLCLSFQRGTIFLFLCLSSVFLYLYLLSNEILGDVALPSALFRS